MIDAVVAFMLPYAFRWVIVVPAMPENWFIILQGKSQRQLLLGNAGSLVYEGYHPPSKSWRPLRTKHPLWAFAFNLHTS